MIRVPALKYVCPGLTSSASVLSRFSCVRFFATTRTLSCQASLSKGFSTQEYWSGLPLPPPGDLPDAGTEPGSLMSTALAGEFFTTSANREAQYLANYLSVCRNFSLLHWQSGDSNIVYLIRSWKG